MRVLYIHQYFYTPDMIGMAGARSYEMARRLVAAGHEVQMVTTATRPTDHSRDWYETTEAGIRVHWLPLPISNKTAFRQRITKFLKFALLSTVRALSIDCDVVYATSGPLTVALPAMAAAFLKRKPMVFEVRDLWPEGAIELGVLRNPIAIRAALALEWAAYRASCHIVALSPGMRTGIVQNGVPRSKVTVIPNACDLDVFASNTDGSSIRSELGLNGKFLLVYFGTMGLANGLGYVLDAAAELKRRGVNDIAIVLHGDGMERSKLEATARAQNLDNVLFTNPVAQKHWVAELAAAADIGMTIYRNVPVLATCSPNKLFDTLAAGKPVLVNMPGDLQNLVERNRCGIFVKPDDPADFADKVIKLKADRELLDEYGRNARLLGERLFSRDLLARRLENVLQHVVRTRQGPPQTLEEEWA